jgi:Ser/Thr protein kinase RdoA (MazF antagonist)
MTEPAVPEWVIAVVGAVRDAVPIRWGFTNESWAVTTAGGRRLVVTRLADPGSAPILIDRGPAVAARLAAAGIASPVPIAELSDRVRSVVTSAFLDGVPGMELMSDATGAALVGRVLGGAWLALRRVDPSGLDLDDAWSRPAALADAGLRWLEATGDALDAEAAARARGRIAGLPSLGGAWEAGFVHGDLVPANVLLDGETLGALLDLETVRVGPRLLDAAWFRWIVRYHHPALEPRAWAGFVAVSGLRADDTMTGALLDILPVVRILEILAGDGMGGAARARWVEQLRAGVDALSA